jgi:subtilisin-like proprotein convertase family protein
MDEHSRKYLWMVAVAVCILQYSAFGMAYYSFGKNINLSFGAENKKTMLKTDIFVPVHGKVLDLNLALNIRHTSICDLKIYVKSPSGTLALINSYDVDTFVPGRTDFRWTIFDAESNISIDAGSSPFSGRFRPNGPDSLTAFYGQQSYGKWEVWGYDWVYYNTGTFKDARLDFFINPEPVSILIMLIGGIAIRLKR